MPAASRPRVELEPLIGSFANMLVLRIDTSDEIVKSALLTLDGAVVNPALTPEPTAAATIPATGPGTTS